MKLTEPSAKIDAYMRLYGNDLFAALDGYGDDVGMSYVRALWHYWHHTHCTGLPDDNDYLRRVCRQEMTSWGRVRPIVFGQYFKKEDDGQWHQPNCRKIYRDSLLDYAARVESARKARDAKRAKLSGTKPDAKPDIKPDASVETRHDSTADHGVEPEAVGGANVGNCPESGQKDTKTVDTNPDANAGNNSRKPLDPKSDPSFSVCTEVELPPRFPKTKEDAINMAGTGVPDDFIILTWNKAMGRGGRDAHEVLIVSWPHHVATEWAYQQNRQAKEKQHGTRSVNHGTDRNAGTYNEGKGHLYAKAAKRG